MNIGKNWDCTRKIWLKPKKAAYSPLPRYTFGVKTIIIAGIELDCTLDNQNCGASILVGVGPGRWMGPRELHVEESLHGLGY